MCGQKSGCGHGWKDKGMKGDGDWQEKFEKMDPEEKKEMLEKKQRLLKEKMAWVEEELGKLGK